jgi:hypothetical protein
MNFDQPLQSVDAVVVYFLRIFSFQACDTGYKQGPLIFFLAQSEFLTFVSGLFILGY